MNRNILMPRSKSPNTKQAEICTHLQGFSYDKGDFLLKVTSLTRLHNSEAI